MTKKEVVDFIKKNREQIERFAENRNFGRLTRAEQKGYVEAYQYIEPKATLCFTCGRSAQIMGRRMLQWFEDAKPKRRKK